LIEFVCENSLQVPSSSTTLNYHGQMIDVNTQQFDTLRVLGSGSYGVVLAVTIQDHPEVEMAVKVSELKGIKFVDWSCSMIENCPRNTRRPSSINIHGFNNDSRSWFS
jgi:hypothetical protein